MRRLSYRLAARRELAATLEFITRESGSLATGQNFTDELRRQCKRLADLPGTLGRERPELSPGLRSSPYKGYVIFFRYVGEMVFEVVTILEGHRDVEEHFRSEPE